MRKLIMSVVVMSVLVAAGFAQASVAAQNTAILTDLVVDDITLTGNGISPKFDPNVNSYVMNVQSDIYGVKVTPVANEGAKVTVDDNEVPAGGSYIVKLEEKYEFYAVDYSVDVKVVVTEGGTSNTYNIKVIRENGKAKYDLFEEKVYNDKETGLSMPYLIYVPTKYDKSKNYPVVFALHGSGQRAQSIDMILKRYEMATVWAVDSEKGINECIVIAPHCASKDDVVNWTTLMSYRTGVGDNAFGLTDQSIAAYNLLKDVMKEYSVDEKKVYMTGLSAGGFATFSIAVEHPETFSALVSVCGGVNPEQAGKLKGIPIWIFHAADDPTVNPDEFLYPTLKSLGEAGVTYKSTVYAAGKVFHPSAHFSWVAAYANKDMRNWVFQQSK